MSRPDRTAPFWSLAWFFLLHSIHFISTGSESKPGPEPLFVLQRWDTCVRCHRASLPISALLFPGGVQNGTDPRGHRLLFGSARRPLLMPRRCSLSHTFNSFVWRSAKIHSTVKSRCRRFHLEVYMHLHLDWFFDISRSIQIHYRKRTIFVRENRTKKTYGRNSFEYLCLHSQWEMYIVQYVQWYTVFIWERLWICTIWILYCWHIPVCTQTQAGKEK